MISFDPATSRLATNTTVSTGQNAGQAQTVTTQAYSRPGDRDTVDLTSRPPKGTQNRPDLISRVRAQIMQGNYLTDHKLDVTTDRILHTLSA